MTTRLGSILRQARTTAELRQSDVAARADVDQSMVSLYERGRREPTWPTFLRLLDATSTTADVRVAKLADEPGRVTLDRLAGHLLAADTESGRRRLVLDFVGRHAAADPAHRAALLLSCPGPTGDARWDSVVGALAEHLAFHDAMDAPQWCTENHRFLSQPWFWVDLPSVRRRALVNAPTAFRRRNVWIDRADLERV